MKKISNHYFIRILGNPNDNHKLEFGFILETNAKVVRKIIKSNCTFEEIVYELVDLFDLNKSNSLLNIYVHGFWADTKIIWSTITKKINNQIFFNEDEANQIKLSVIWGSSYSYKKSINIAYEKGKIFSSFIDRILQASTNKIKINFLSHSLGNKFMQGVLEALNKEKRIEKLINYWILVAPDLENTIFSVENALNSINELVENVVVFYNNNDLVLSVTGFYHKDKRLGKYGVEESDCEKSNMIFIDVSDVIVCNGLLSKVIQHNYFFTNDMVMRDINNILFNDEIFSNKKSSNFNNHFELQK